MVAALSGPTLFFFRAYGLKVFIDLSRAMAAFGVCVPHQKGQEGWVAQAKVLEISVLMHSQDSGGGLSLSRSGKPFVFFTGPSCVRKFGMFL